MDMGKFRNISVILPDGVILKKNVIKILERKTENVVINFSPVIQVYNILYLTKLLKWIDKLQDIYGKLHRNLIICTGPSFFDLAILPENVRIIALKKIYDYRKNFSGDDPHFMDCLDGIISILKKVKKENSSLELNRFFKYTSILDRKRKNDFKTTLPHLHKLLYNEWISSS